MFIPPLDALRLRRGVEYLHHLGPRATAELLAEFAGQTSTLPVLLDLLADYQKRLSPTMLQAVGADRFPRQPIHVVRA